MKRRNRIAMQASGYTVSGSFAVASAVALVSGKGFSSLFYGALSSLTAAATNELSGDQAATGTAATGTSSSEPEPKKTGAAKPTAA